MNHLLRKIDLTSLRLFVAVCQERNIARAAEREFIAPSAVSRRITEIESIIGLPVIERQSRGITVTPVGETVLRYAEAVIANIEALGAELSQYFSGTKGQVKMVANLSAILQFLPEDIAAFQRIYPEVNIDLEEQDSLQVLKAIDERAVDIGICNEIPEVEAFAWLPYRSDRLSLAVPSGHHLADAPRIAFSDILQESFVGFREGSALSQLLRQQAARHRTELSLRIRVGSLDALCRMVHAGLGVAVVPHQVGALYLNTLNLKLVPLSDPWAVRKLVIVFKSREKLGITARTLVNFLTGQN